MFFILFSFSFLRRTRTSDLLKTVVSNNATTKPNSNIIELISDANPTKSTTRSDKSKLNVKTPPEGPCDSRKTIDTNTKCTPNSAIASADSSGLVRKRISRNVAWGSPIKTNLPSSDTQTTENADNETENAESTDRMEVEHVENNIQQPIEDDGFESFNGKSSSGEENNANQNPASKDEVVASEILVNSPKSLNVSSKITCSNAETDTQMADSVGRISRLFWLIRGFTLDFFYHHPQPSSRFFASKLGAKPESTDTEGESDEGGNLSSPGLGPETANSTTEWIGITTNSTSKFYYFQG
jgi:hypothetical protein